MGPARAHSTRLPARGARRYPSDLTDAQWQVIAAHLPAERTGRRGRPRIWPARRIVEAILYLNRTGCAWRYLPGDFPPWQTVYGYFAAWRDDGTLARLHGQLRAQLRTAAGRQPEPTAAVIDSQSVRAADTVPKASRGWDAAKKINGRKRHIAVDATGLLLDVVITAASVQDRDAARPLLWNLHRACPSVRLAWADSGTRRTGSPPGPPPCASRCRSSAGPMTCTPSKCFPAVGSWNGPSPGSASTAAPPATTKPCPPATKP